MHGCAHRGPMKHLLVPSMLCVLALAGCLDAPADAAVAALPPEAVPGGLLEGELFLPPSSGQDRIESVVELPANASGLRIDARVALGSRYGPLDAPVQTADVLVELRGPDGDVLADAHLSAQQTEATLEGDTVRDGPHTLALRSYGGSDEQENGDYVAYRVQVTPLG